MSDENLDFSGLFKLETLVHMDVVTSSFYEVGLQKLIAVVGEDTLEFLHINSEGNRSQKNFPWDFKLHPIRCVCFEPSGTWLLVASDRSIALIPYLPVFDPKANYDHKWSITDPTIIPFISNRPVSIVWWLTKSADNIAIIALRGGIILFYSLDTKTLLGEVRVAIEISDVQICVDDSLDVIVLLITGTVYQHLKLILEHRSVDYNWIRDLNGTLDVKEKKDGIMAYLTDKIDKFSLLTQGTSEKSAQFEYSRSPVEYTPQFRKGSNKWILTTQNVNGLHVITAFDVKSGAIFLENTENDKPTRQLQPVLTKGNNYIQALWCQKLLFLFTENAIEVHSTSFSTLTDGHRPNNATETCLWRVDLPTCLYRGFLLSPRTPPRQQSSWKPPTFLCDLKLPRFPLEPCLVVGHKGVFLLTTMWDACEWLTSKIRLKGRGAECCAAALDAPLTPILCAASDVLLSRGKVQPARYFYTLSKQPLGGWLARLAVFGHVADLATLKPDSELSYSTLLMNVLAQILMLVTDPQTNSGVTVTCQDVSTPELEEICGLSAGLGLWEVLSAFSVQRGRPQLALAAICSRRYVCEGALKYLQNRKYLLPYLLDVDSAALYKYLEENCYCFDTELIKRFVIWLSPLSEQLSPVMRDLRNGVNNTHTTRMQQLISTFTRLVSELDKRQPSLGVRHTFDPRPEVGADKFVPRRTLSCGLEHWAIADGGDAVVVSATTDIRPELIGRVVSVSCGRHHTLILTENGVYASGDNTHGQLGVGARWQLGWGKMAEAGGEPLRVRGPWSARVTFVAAGQYHNAAIDIDGNLYTWGWGIHGQLGLGDIYDAFVPKLVTALQGKKIVQAGCGACHTVVLANTGEVFAFGASMFGQLGSGGYEKSAVPRRVPNLPGNVKMISVGYFHNLALTVSNEVYKWGASPQAVRAGVVFSRRAANTPPADEAPSDTHLSAALVDTSSVAGNIVQMSAGWHHSCILTHLGYIYTWGLNLDGQLGSGDRKQITQPHRVEIPPENLVDEDVAEQALQPSPTTTADPLYVTRALVGCGGDFTMFVNDQGKIFIAGQTKEEKDPCNSDERVILMWTTKRVITIPGRRAATANSRHVFRYLDKVDDLLDYNTSDEQCMLPLRTNPVAKMSDFKREGWLDEVLHKLKPWIKESDVADNKNLAAKLAHHNKKYFECIKLQLENLKIVKNAVERKPQRIYKGSKSSISTVVKNRLKDMGMAYLNGTSFPKYSDIYASLPCNCDEPPPTEEIKTEKYPEAVESAEDLAIKAGKILDESLTNFPASYESWNEYLSVTKEFFLQNKLPGTELEAVLKKHVEKNASLVSSAVLCSEECASYEKLFTPKFYLNVCNKLLDTSG